METEHFILGLAWLGYGLLHSLLAATTIKHRLKLSLGSAYRWYRLFYSALAVLGAMAIYLWGATLPATRLWPPSNTVRIIGLIVATYGFLVLRLAMRQYPFRSFVGLSPQSDDDTLALKTDGIHRFVRHPLYAGLILLMVGFLFFAPTYTHLITVAALLIYLIPGIYWEEQKLIHRFGEAYLQYRKEVPAILPYQLLRKKS